MDLKGILDGMKDCPCGGEHNFDTEVIEIGSGITEKAGTILQKAGFPEDILLVADENTLTASAGLLESLASFRVKKLIYDNMLYARAEQIAEISALMGDVKGVISVGTGSLNDICRVAAYQRGADLCIYATAASMDGFASDTAPIVKDNFKSSWQAVQPRIILADTKVLAAAPVELKSAGFGDMAAKYMGIVDWKLAHLLIGEYWCDRVAAMTMDAVDRIMRLADHVTDADEQAAGVVMEALVLMGLAMKLARCSRPASGAEHIVSHYWECYKVNRGIWPGFHGQKVGVATVLLNRVYRNIAERVETVRPTKDATDWAEVMAKYDPQMHADIKKLNVPTTVTDLVSPEKLQRLWPQIRALILETLPTNEVLTAKMASAGAIMNPRKIHVDRKLLEDGLRYHPYMRSRLTLTRLLPMLGIDIMDYLY